MTPEIVLALPRFDEGAVRLRKRIPINLLSLAAELVSVPGLGVHVLDGESGGWSSEVLATRIAERRPSVIGISVCSPAHRAAMRVASSVRQLLPDAVIVFGGKHVTHWDIPDQQCVDLLVAGEGERVVRSLGLAVMRGANREELIDAALRHPNTRQPGSSSRARIPEPFDVARPRRMPYEVLDPPLDYYARGVALVEHSRGCRGRCSYCLASRYRTTTGYRDTQDVVRELQHLRQRGFHEFFFTDDDFASSPERVEALCRGIIAAGIDLAFDANVRPDSLCACAGVAELLRSAGCRCLWLGVETGSPVVARSFSKGFTFRDCEEATAIAMRAARFVRTNWIIGAPDEQASTIRESIELALRLRDIGPHLPHVSFLVPYPGSPMYALATRLGLTSLEALERENWVTHVRALMPSQHLGVADIEDGFRQFHAALYSSDFLSSLDAAARTEALSILESAGFTVAEGHVLTWDR